MYKTLKILLLSALVSGIFCGSTMAEDSGKIKLKLMRVPFPDVRNPWMKAERAIYERFLKLNPDIEVTTATGIHLPNQSGMDIITMSIAGGTAPDVFSMSFRSSSTFIQEGFLMPLDDHLVKANMTLDGIHPKVLPVIKQNRPPDTKEHIYLFPYGSPTVMALLYRKDLFKEAGLDPKKYPKNWEEFIEYAKKITDPAKGIYGYGSEPGADEVWQFANFIYQAGGDFIAKDKNGEWKTVYASDESAAALKFYSRLWHEKFTKNGKTYNGVVYKSDDTPTVWRNGKIGMTFGYLDAQLLFPPGTNVDLIGIAPLPAGPSGFGGCEFNQQMLGINSQTKDPRVIDAALRYIKFMASEEPDRIITNIFVAEGLRKLVHPKYLKKYGYTALLSEADPSWVKISEEAFKYAHPEPYGKNCNMIYNELAPLLDEVALYPELDFKAALIKFAKHTDEQMIGYVDPKEMKKRRTVVGLCLLLILGILVFFGIKSMKLVKDVGNKAPANVNKASARVHIYAWLFMSIAVLSVLLWSYYPVARGLIMAFQDYKIVGESRFVGIDNFVSVFWQPIFWKALKNTFYYVFLTISLGFFAPVLLALLLNEIPRGSLFFRIIFYLPTVTSGIVVLLLWKQFYDPSDAGFFNSVLGFFKIPPQKWLADPRLAMICLVIPSIWSSVGAGSIFYLAALKNVPEELYEAASIDGAGIIGKVWNVTLPTLQMVLIINFVGAFIGSFYATERILIMTGGGPSQATHVLGIEIFYNSFVYLKFGYSVAIAWILGSMLVGFTVLQLKLLKEARFTTTNKL